MEIIVTGANGYIGAHIVEKLYESGHHVFAIDRNNTRLPNGVEFINVDIFNKTEVDSLPNNVDAVLHLAWVDGFNHSSLSHIELLPLHFSFLRQCVEKGSKRLVVMGTMHEVGYWEGAIDEHTPTRPLSYYGIAKNTLRDLVSTYCKMNNIPWQWLRAYYITGDDSSSHSIFSKILQWDKEGKTSFPFTDGSMQYDFLDIHQLATQIVRACTQNEVLGIINVCSGQPVSIKDKVEDFIKANHLSIRPEYGVFPKRPYDSPCVYGDAKKISAIMTKAEDS